MIRPLTLAACAMAAISAVGAQNRAETAEPRPLMGNYHVYGGSVADMVPPTPNDRQLAFRFEGQTAQDLFSYIGPDVKKAKACTDDPEYRERRRGHLHCVYWRKTGYRCFLGLDLKTGKSDYGSTC